MIKRFCRLWCSAWLVTAMGLTAPMALADMTDALNKGCQSCHGDPPRGKAPTIAALAARYASAANDEHQLRQLAD